MNSLNFTTRFENQTSAQQAKDSLNGWDLYEGYNTLKIEYAKVNLLLLEEEVVAVVRAVVLVVKELFLILWS